MEREQGRVGVVTTALRCLVVALIVAIALTLLAASRNSRPPLSASSLAPVVIGSAHLSASPTLFSTAAAGVYCPSGVAFSPDGATIAIVGTTQACAGAHASPNAQHKLVLFDVARGTVRGIVSLDALAIAQMPMAGRGRVRGMRFAGLGWDPSGARYAAAFEAFDRDDAPSLDDVVCSGLLLVAADDMSATAVAGDPGFFASATGGYVGLPVWDLRAGGATPPALPAPGLAYAWQHGAQPRPIIPLGPDPLKAVPVNAGPRYPVGNPARDATFTIWQPGVLLGQEVAPPAAGRDAAFVTAFTSWSPDGAYATYLVTGVALPPMTSTRRDDGEPHPIPLVQAPPWLGQTPPRDPALAAVQGEIGPAGWAAVAWNPSGSLLASLSCSTGGPRIVVRETDAGTTLDATVLPQADAGSLCGASGQGEPLGAYGTPMPRLLWSPDGARLLLVNLAGEAAEMWTVSG